MSNSGMSDFVISFSLEAMLGERMDMDTWVSSDHYGGYLVVCSVFFKYGYGLG